MPDHLFVCIRFEGVFLKIGITAFQTALPSLALCRYDGQS